MSSSPSSSTPIKYTLRSVARAVIAARYFNLEPATKRSYMLDVDIDPETLSSIDKDLPRTAQAEPLVHARIGRIRAMLLRHVGEDPQLGYCQGMNLVAAVFAVASKNQDEAYRRFRAFVHGVRGLWLPGFPLLDLGTARFISIAGDRPWFQHMQAFGIESSMFLPQALMTMLAMWLPMPTIVQCLRLLERLGLDGIVAMTVAVMDQAQHRILEQQSMEGILHELSNIKVSAADASDLKTAARAILISQKAAKDKALSQQNWNGLLRGFGSAPARRQVAPEASQSIIPTERTTSARELTATFGMQDRKQPLQQYGFDNVIAGLFSFPRVGACA